MAILVAVPCAVRSTITPVCLPNGFREKPTLLVLATLAPLPNPFFVLKEPVLAPMCSKAQPGSKPKARPGSKPKARPCSKPKAHPRPCSKAHPRSKAELVGISTRSKILKKGYVAKGTIVEVYPEEGVRARWFMRVVNGELICDENGNQLITKCIWCKKNSTIIDKKRQKNPVSCFVASVMATGVKSI